MKIYLRYILFICVCFFTISTFTQSAQLPNQSTGHNNRLKPRVAGVKPKITRIGSEAQTKKIIVKLIEGSKLRISNNHLKSLSGLNLKNIQQVLSDKSLSKIRPLISISPDKLDKQKSILENKIGRQLADFNNYFTIEVSSPEEAEMLINRLNELPEVEIAYAQPHYEPSVDISPPTPDYADSQIYFSPAPDGIDADYALTLTGGDGSGIKIIDIEGDWRIDHEDLELGSEVILGGTRAGTLLWRDHGSAVIGILVSEDNGYGITGIVPSAGIGLISHISLGIAEAVLLAADSLSAGDIILIELQAPGPRYNYQVRSDQMGYICVEYWQDVFDAVQYAWAKGIIVCAGAGNGRENLDDPVYNNAFDTAHRNSHAILIGAGSPPSGTYGTPRSRIVFSNYGERVNLQGQGAEVTTLGYGALFDGDGDERQYYTDAFTGTSAAAPIVVGAVAALQGIYKARYNGATLIADRIRDIFISTGSPQQANTSQNIGPQPDLLAAEAILPEPYDLVADPIFIDTSEVYGQALQLSVAIQNISITETIEYSAIVEELGQDTADLWLSIINPDGLIAPANQITMDIDLAPELSSPFAMLNKGQIVVAFGPEGGSLDEEVIIPIFLEAVCADTSYNIASSVLGDTVDFEWLDITTNGYIAPSHLWYNSYTSVDILDDGTFGPVDLNFDFPFYDSTYDEIYIGVNGAISFTDSDVNMAGFYSDLDIPNSDFETIVSPFWNDLNMDPGINGHGTVYYYYPSTKDTFIVQYNQIGNFTSAVDTLTTFQIILTRNGNIKFQYLDVGETALEETAVIGISGRNCFSTAYIIRGNPSGNVIGDSSAILFDLVEAIWEMSGDVNGDDNINLGDAIFLINWIFKGGSTPQNLLESDCNCDGKSNLGDAIYIINYVFKSGPEPCLYEVQ